MFNFSTSTIYLQISTWLKSKIFGASVEIPSSTQDVLPSNNNFYLLTKEQHESIREDLSGLLRQNVLLQQSLREEQTKSTANVEDLFLELLEVTDALESLLTYLKNNPDVNVEFFQRLPRSLGAVNRKLLNTLSKRHVLPIELQSDQPDFNLCRVVDREFRDDVEEQTIVQIVRQGFRFEEKVLRPTEVIISMKSEP